MQQQLNILLLEDNPVDAEILQRLLAKKKLLGEFRLASNKKAFLNALDEFRPDIILSDHALPQFNSIGALALARQQFPDIPFIMVTGSVSEEFAAEIIKLGADDYILKDRIARLPIAIEKAIKKRQLETEKILALQNLVRSEEKYRILIQRITDAFIALDKNWCYTYLNEKAGELLHRNTSELLGKNVWEIFPDAVGSSTYKAFYKAMKEQHFVNNIDYYPPLDLWQENHIYPSKEGLSVFIRDITQKKKAELAMQRSEQVRKMIMSSALDAIICIDMMGTITVWNTQSEKLFGWKENEALGKTLTDTIIPEQYKELHTAGFSNYKETGQGPVLNKLFEITALKKTGIEFPIELFIVPIKQEEGIFFCAFIRDISERKRAEQEREFDRNNLSSLINNTADLMWSVDRNLNLITCNDAFNKMITLASGKPLKKGDTVLSSQFTGDQLKRYKKFYERALAGETYTIIDRFNYPAEFWVEISFYPIRQDNMVIGTACFSRDITERRKAEEEILQTQMRLKQAQEVAHLGSWFVNFETNTSKWSDEAYRIYGLAPGDHNLSISEWMSFVHPDDFEYVKKIIDDSQQTLKDISFYHRILRKDGSIRYLYSESKFEFNNEGKPTALYGIAHDITEMKKLEANLREQQRQEQIKITATALEAQEKERNAIGQELHDNVNQILVGTKLVLSLVKNNHADTDEIVANSIDNIQKAINENRKIAHELVAPDMKTETLADQLRLLTDQMLKVGGVDVYIDAARLKENLLTEDQKIAVYRIAQEQCTNIVKYAQASIVNIFVSTNNNDFKMVITDDGKGMEADKQTDGIGLRNIKGRLSIYNGRANIITAPGKGFTLEIMIPL